MRHRATAVVTTVAAVALIAGCGEDAHVPALPKSGSITKAQAKAFANAVNLGVADVPGMVSVS
jgi:hypothetical protein